MGALSRRRFLHAVGGLGLGTLSAGLVSSCGLLPPQLRLAPAGQKVPRIGFLGATTESAEAARLEAFRQGLRELGYAEGQTIAIEWRWAEGQFDRLPALAAELVSLDVELIVAGGSTSTRAAQGVTSTIPIVMAQAPDPLGSGFVASLARPGGNITGLSTLAPEISGKRLELLMGVVPHLARLAVLDDAPTPGNAQALRETELAARATGVQLHYRDVRRPEEIEDAFPRGGRGTRRRDRRAREPALHPRAEADRRPVGAVPAARVLRIGGIRERRRAHDLQREHRRPVPAHRHLRGQDPQG